MLRVSAWHGQDLYALHKCFLSTKAAIYYYTSHYLCGFPYDAILNFYPALNSKELMASNFTWSNISKISLKRNTHYYTVISDESWPQQSQLIALLERVTTTSFPLWIGRYRSWKLWSPIILLYICVLRALSMKIRDLVDMDSNTQLSSNRSDKQQTFTTEEKGWGCNDS